MLVIAIRLIFSFGLAHENRISFCLYTLNRVAFDIRKKIVQSSPVFLDLGVATPLGLPKLLFGATCELKFNVGYVF